MNKRQNLNLLNEFHLGMFEYKNMPETLRANYLEYYFIKYGCVAVFRIPEGNSSPGYKVGDLICTPCSFGTDLDPYGRGTEIIATTRNGWEIRYNRFSDDVAVGFNNLSELPCVDMKDDAQMLAEIDKSLNFLIFWTRIAPLIRVADEKERAELLTAFNNIKEGIPITLVTKKILSDDFMKDTFTVEDVTKPDLADKIQYTARLREDIIRWHYTRYGQVVQGDTKLAQQSVDEVNGTVSSSLIIPLNMLSCRKAFVDEINKKFGTNIEVELSGAWRAEVTKYENNSGEPEIDDTADPADPADPAEPETAEPKEEKERGSDDET